MLRFGLLLILSLTCLETCRCLPSPTSHHSSNVASSSSSSKELTTNNKQNQTDGPLLTSSSSPSTDDDIKTTKPKKKSEKQKKASSAASTTKQFCYARLKQEWKDAIQAGIAFDWSKGQPHGKSPQQPSHIWIGPLGESLSLWHFTITGLPGSVYHGGVYHGRIVLPPDYPSAPPTISLWTPSGRFRVGANICLSASAHHPESWMPHVWNLRTLVESLRLHLCTTTVASEIGGLHDSNDERRAYARASRTWRKAMVNKKNRVVEVNHAVMLEKGYLPAVPLMEEEEEDDVTNAALDERIEELIQEVAGDNDGDAAVVVAKSKKRRRRSQVASTPVSLPQGPLHQTLQFVRHPIGFSVLLFAVLFCYLNYF